MNAPGFHLTFVPKQGKAIDHIAKLIEKDQITPLLSDVLKSNKIAPESIFFEHIESGAGKKGGVFEGFQFRKYRGELSGVRKRLLSIEPFTTKFELSLLRSNTRDGLLVRSLDQPKSEYAKFVTEGLYNMLLQKMSKDGPIQFSQIVRSGTI